MKSSKNRTAKSIPDATYRLQFNKDFPLRRGIELIPYLRSLGISHVYTSPLLEARKGSLHCYDVTGHAALNPEICSMEEFEKFTEELERNEMSLILDIVPNHMAADVQNAMWYDLLKNGKESEFAQYFDIYWKPGRDDKIILPILARPLDELMVSKKILLSLDKGTMELSFEVDGTKLPVSLTTYESINASSNAGNPDIERINSQKEKLIELLNQQNYRLEYWVDGLADLNYRKFFNVTDLVGIREERAAVFDEAHSLIFNLIRQNRIAGIRVDHPDGLWDPKGYLSKLHKISTKVTRGKPYILVEKILTKPAEKLPPWKVSGTTGYDFLNDLNGIFVDTRSEKKFANTYAEFTGDKRDFDEISFDSKMLVIERFMQPDVHRLVDIISKEDATIEKKSARRAIELFAASFPVYRTYIDGRALISRSDLDLMKIALGQAERVAKKERVSDAISAIRKMLRKVRSSPNAREFFMTFQQLTSAVVAKGVEDTAFYRYFPLASLNEVGGAPDIFGITAEEFHQRNVDRLSTWPHSMLASSTHDTKRSEDVRSRINVLSEMPEEWADRVLKWRKINEGFRHDNPPSRQIEYLLYQTLVGSLDIHGVEEKAGSVVVKSAYVQKLVDYARKASKESKVESSWIFPDEAYDTGLERFVREILSPENSSFLKDLVEFSTKIRKLGRLNSLSQLLLKLTCPGVPDIYQGTELWDYSLVDPDNRRAVDFRARQNLILDLQGRMNNESQEELVFSLMKNPDDGAIKLFLTMTILNYRRKNRELFSSGDYLPLTFRGKRKDNVIGFVRTTKEKGLLVLASRFFNGLCVDGKHSVGKDCWTDTYVGLPKVFKKRSRLTNILTGEEINPNQRLRLSTAFKIMPFALIESE